MAPTWHLTWNSPLAGVSSPVGRRPFSISSNTLGKASLSPMAPGTLDLREGKDDFH
jgi:hypothetical protein